MVGKHNGFVTKIGHPIMTLNCNIHQENLCAKISKSDLTSSDVDRDENCEFSCRTLCSDTQTISDFT